jgi:hypothetical protein
VSIAGVTTFHRELRSRKLAQRPGDRSMQSGATAFTAIAVAILICMSSPAAWALDKAPVLTMDLAKKLAAGCETKAKEMNWKMNIWCR